jgi:hypothetical protein
VNEQKKNEKNRNYEQEAETRRDDQIPITEMGQHITHY